MIPYVPEDHVSYMFKALDTDQSGFIDLGQFYAFCDVIQFSFERYPAHSPLERRFPAQFARLHLHAVQAPPARPPTARWASSHTRRRFVVVAKS